MTERRAKILTLVSAALLVTSSWHLAQAGASPVDSDHDGIPDELEREAQQAQSRVEQRKPQLGGIIGSILNAAMRR